MIDEAYDRAYREARAELADLFEAVIRLFRHPGLRAGIRLFFSGSREGRRTPE
jgi:hypothetical protein